MLLICLVGFNSTILREQYFWLSISAASYLPLRTVKCCSVVFSVTFPRWSVPHPKFVNILDTNMNESNQLSVTKIYLARANLVLVRLIALFNRTVYPIMLCYAFLLQQTSLGSTAGNAPQLLRALRSHVQSVSFYRRMGIRHPTFTTAVPYGKVIDQTGWCSRRPLVNV